MINLTEKEKNILINLIEHELEYIGNEIDNSPYYEEGLDKEYYKLYKIKEKLSK